MANRCVEENTEKSAVDLSSIGKFGKEALHSAGGPVPLSPYDALALGIGEKYQSLVGGIQKIIDRDAQNNS